MADRDVNIKVKVDDSGARAILNGVETKIKDIGSSAQGAAGGLSQFFSGFASGGLETLVTGLGAAVAGFSAFKAIAGVIELAKLGDDVNDAGSAFAELAAKSGMSADALIGKLGPAVQGSVDNLTLMQKANKAMQAGLDPAVFDRVVAAAKRYADATGTDVTSAIDMYTQALTRQRPAQLEHLGLLKDGKIFLDGYTVAADGGVAAADGLTDALAQVATSTKNADERLASFVDSSTFLNTIGIALAKTWAWLREVLDDAAVGFLYVADSITNYLTKAFNDTIKGAQVVGNLLSQIAHGELPSYSKAVANVVANIKDETKQVDGVTIALKKEKDAHKEASDGADKQAAQIERLTQKINEFTTGTKFPEWAGQIDAIANNIQDVFNNASLSGAQVTGALQVIKDTLVQMGVPLEVIDAGFDRAFGKATQGKIGDIKDGLDETKKSADELGRSIGGALASGIAEFAKGGNGLGSILGGIGSSFGASLTKGLSGTLGTVLGADVGSMISSAAGPLGALAGEEISQGLTSAFHHVFGGRDAQGKMRDDVQKFLDEAIDTDNLQVFIDGKLGKLNFDFLRGGGGSAFTTGTFDDYFAGLTSSAQGAFSAVSAGIAQLAGVSSEVAPQIAAVLSQDIGGSLLNLQLVAQSLGLDMSKLGDIVVSSFKKGGLSFAEAEQQLIGIQKLTEKGIPDALGATTQAFQNFENAGVKGGQASIKSLQDLAAEATELHLKTLPALEAALLADSSNNKEAVKKLFDALHIYGVNSLDQLQSISDQTAIAVGANLQAANFPFAETAQKLDDLKKQIDSIPADIQRNLTFNVKVNASDADRQLVTKSQVTIPSGSQAPKSQPGLAA